MTEAEITEKVLSTSLTEIENDGGANCVVCGAFLKGETFADVVDELVDHIDEGHRPDPDGVSAEGVQTA